MNGSAICFDKVCDMDGDVVSPAGFNQRARIGAIDDFACKLEVAIWRNDVVGDVEEILAIDT